MPEATIEKPETQATEPQTQTQPTPEATPEKQEKTFEEMIAEDPGKAASEIKKLREEAKNNRLKANQLDELLAEQEKQKAEAEQKKLEAEGNYKEVLKTKEAEIAELNEYKTKYLEIEESQKKILDDKVGKLENDDHKKLIESSSLPLTERIALADSLIGSKTPPPRPTERGQGQRSTGPEPSKESRLFDPNR